jgi:hypothetical protein
MIFVRVTAKALMLPHFFNLRSAALAIVFGVMAMQADPAQQMAGGPQTQATQPPGQPPATAAAAGTVPETAPAEDITEEQLRQMLVGKPLFLRGGYLANHLTFGADGVLASESPRGSYTLCAIEIENVHLTKRKLELTGQRYGLHFLGALAYESSNSAVDRVQLTAGKQEVSIVIDREGIEEPKKFGFLPFKLGSFEHPPATPPAKSPSTEGSSSPASSASTPTAPTSGNPPATPLTQEKADQTLKTALDRIFAQGIDSRLIASMPQFWQFYYQAAAAKTDYSPKDPAVLRQKIVDQKARLLTNFVPPSNEYAQSHAVSGIALYHVVVGADGKAGEVAVARPIGFGLDENAVASIREASFEPAIKDGKAVPVLLDLVVEFRIYSDRTATKDKPDAAQPSAPILPGPYSVQHP